MRSLQNVLSLISLAGGVALASACGAVNADAPGTGPDGGTGTPVDPGGAGVIPCAVDKVLAANCRSCHGSPPTYGAPMPLVTLADLHAAAATSSSRKVYELVPERIADDIKPMPQPPNARLSAADRATLSQWAAVGAPRPDRRTAWSRLRLRR
jgi:hypothetical protein